MTNPRIILLFPFILYSLILNAQGNRTYRFVNFGEKDGLLDKYIYCAAQDNKGYMWFGTGSGLYRYDGHNFIHFNSTADRPGQTIGNILQSIIKDDEGNLWLGSVNTLQWFNPVTNKFWTPDYSTPENKKPGSSYILNFTKGTKGNMWIATSSNHFFRFNKKDSTFTHFNSFPSTATKGTILVAEIQNEAFAIHPEGIYRFSQNGSYLSFHKTEKDEIINAVIDLKNNRIIVTTLQSGLFYFNCTTRQYTSDFADNNTAQKSNILCATINPAGDYFLGSYQLDYFKADGNEHLSFTKDKNDEYSLQAEKIVKLFFDRENNLWICSHNGLSMMPWQNNQVKTIPLYDKISKNTVEPSAVFSIPGSDKIFITNTSTSGLIIYNKKTGEVSTLRNPIGKTVEQQRFISFILAPGNGIYLSDDINLYKYNPENNQLTIYEIKDQNGKTLYKPGRNVYDRNGNIYINSENNGFYIWKYQSGKLIHYNKWDIDKKSTDKTDNNIAPCVIDSKNNCWFTSGNGIYKYDPVSENFTHHAYAESPGNPPVGQSSYIAEDKFGHLWITTKINGLYEWYIENGKEVLKNYNRLSGIGLPADYNLKIKQSPIDSALWISNITGLLRFDPVSKKVISTISKQNGLAIDDGGYTFNILPDNSLAQLYYGYLNLFNLESYQYNSYKPAVSFNSVRVLNKEYAHILPAKNAKLILSSSENFIQFEFAALVFNNSNQNKYAWLMEGVDPDWVQGNNTNNVSYAALKPGSYHFRVKAANNDGSWGEESVIKINIRPPFYKTWWFITLCIIFFAGAIYIWNKTRINQARKEEKLKAKFQQQIAETEMKALRAQMNPHFIFNSLNSIQKYILKNEHYEASQYLTKFSRLIRLILDHSNQNAISIGSELDLLKLYVEMESLRFDNKFDYQIETDSDISTETSEIPSMLIQPYVENAIWHGLLHKEDRGTLSIRFLKKDDHNIIVTIEDNGVGRERSAELKSKQVLKKKSYGIQITENRISIINRVQNINASAKITDLKNTDGKACGTRVELYIPVKPITH